MKIKSTANMPAKAQVSEMGLPELKQLLRAQKDARPKYMFMKRHEDLAVEYFGLHELKAPETEID